MAGLFSGGEPPSLQRYMIHDTPVYDQNHEPHQDGREAVQEVLKARVLLQLFAEGQMTRLTIVSGGNLRVCLRWCWMREGAREESRGHGDRARGCDGGDQ